MSIYLDLRAAYAPAQTFEYAIDDSMFQAVDNSMAKGGKCVAAVTVTRNADGLDLTFNIRGTATVECDYCLENMDIDINKTETLKIQFADYNEDAEDIVYITRDTAKIDLWPFIYDFIALEIPLTHTHPRGQCSKEMLDTLGKYMVSTIEEGN